MKETFYRDRLHSGWGIDVIVPDAAGREMVDRVIFGELTLSHVEDTSRSAYTSVIEDLAAEGTQALLLACTEIELLIGPSDSSIPVIDSTYAHASAAVTASLD